MRLKLLFAATAFALVLPAFTGFGTVERGDDVARKDAAPHWIPHTPFSMGAWRTRVGNLEEAVRGFVTGEPPHTEAAHPVQASLFGDDETLSPLTNYARPQSWTRDSAPRPPADALALLGDATEESTLELAGLKQASTLVTVLPSDAANVFITLTGRDLNRDLQIIARGEQPSTQKKLIQAGADRVVLPAAIGAMRIANLLTRPSAVEFLELVAGKSTLDVEIDEVVVPTGSSLVGKTDRKSVV